MILRNNKCDLLFITPAVKICRYLTAGVIVALAEYTIKILEEKNGRLSLCILTDFCKTFVQNDTISAIFFLISYFHNSFLYISNLSHIFIVVQKIISWKTGELELICLHGGYPIAISAMYCLGSC